MRCRVDLAQQRKAIQDRPFLAAQRDEADRTGDTKHTQRQQCATRHSIINQGKRHWDAKEDGCGENHYS